MQVGSTRFSTKQFRQIMLLGIAIILAGTTTLLDYVMRPGVTLLMVLVIILVLTLLRMPFVGLVLIFLTFPFDYLFRTPAFSSLTIPLRLGQVVACVLCLGFLLRCIRKMRFPRPTAVGVLFGLFLAANIISMLNTSDVALSLRQLVVLGMWLVTSVPPLFLMPRSDLGRLSLILKLFLGVAAVNGLLGIVQTVLFAASGIEIGVVRHDVVGGGGLRPSAFFSEPNFFGVYLALVFPWFILLLPRALGVKRKQQGLGLILGLTAVVAAAALSANRGAWWAMVAQLMLITLVAMPFSKRPTMRNLLFMLPGIIVCFTLLAIVVFTPLGKNVIVPRMTLMFDLESVSSRWRLGEYQLAFEAIKHHPWIGNGIGMWPRYRGIDKAGYAPPNTYLHILFEAGLFGLTVAMLMVGQLYHILFRALRGCVPEKRPHLQACLISLTGFLLAGMVYDVKYLIAFWPFIGLYLAMAKAYGYGSDDSVC